MKKIKNIILDFDGVLFNSAVEAHLVCENVIKTWSGPPLNSFTFKEFMRFRGKIADSSDFLKYYMMDGERCEELKSEYKLLFYKTRKDLSKTEDYVFKNYPPFAFFNNIIPLIKRFPNNFYILSTRDKVSIHNALLNYVDFLPENIFGQEEYIIHNNKVDILISKNFDLEHCIFVDDLINHLKPFEKYEMKLFQPDWGYDEKTSKYTCSEEFLTDFIRNIFNDTT